jgi:hypothetical protein
MARFDVALHLIGEQNIPNYIAIKHLDAEKHILLATDKTEKVAQRLQHVLPMECASEIFSIEAFNVKLLKERFSELCIMLQGKRIVANITGGTKPMAVVLTQALSVLSDVEICYIETGEKKELISFSSEATTPLNPCIADIKTFVALQRENPLSEERLTPSVLEYRLSKNLYSEHARPNFRWCVDTFANLEKARGDHRLQKVKEEYEHFKAVLRGSQAEQDLASFYEELKGNLHKFCEFLGGKWFESYVYTQLQESKKLKEMIQELRMNVRLQSEDSKTKNRQELDLVYTDAYYLYIIECKSGKVEQKDIQTLENNVRNYGGTYGRGILVALQDQTESEMNLERIRSTQNIMLIDGKRVGQLAIALQQWNAGRYMGS